MKTTAARKGFRLFKRRDDGSEMPATESGYKEKPYYFRFTFRGKAYPRCLETTDATEAQRRAKAKHAEIIAAVSAGEYKRLDATKLRHEHTSTVAQLITAYRTGPAEANAKTRETNIHALRTILGCAEESAATLSLRDLQPAAIRTYFETVTARALAERDQQQAASYRRSANSTWAKAKSLFTPKCLEYYRDKDLYHETLDAFVRAGDLAKFSGRSIPKVSYNPPSDQIITATLTAWEQLTNRDLFLAVGHELSFGLRIAEMAQAQWSWHQIRAGYPVLDGAATVKSGTGLIQVRALDPWFTIMHRRIEQEHWRAEGHIIPGTETYRTDGLFRAVSDWLRQLGWETRKTNHALRAYAGSQVAMKYGIYEAQMFLRHSTVKVTEQNYSHFIQKFKPSDLNTIPARWATTAREFVPTVVPGVSELKALET